MKDDTQLLQDYVDEGSELAFRELVDRHFNSVYSAALRRTNGRTDLAADVSQQVFVSLSRHAQRLRDHPALVAWLHTAARNAALNLMTSEKRRRDREGFASEGLEPGANSPDWNRLRPCLDAALDHLPERERTVIILRFLEQRPYGEIASALRLTENAARMRTERALEKLRLSLRRAGITSTASALAWVLTQHTATAAPAGLVASVTAAALSVPPAQGLLTFIVMNKVTSSLLVATATVGLTTLAWSALAAPTDVSDLEALRAENASLRQTAALDSGTPEAAAVAEAFSQRSSVVVQAVRSRQRTTASPAGALPSSAQEEATPSGHRNRGNATPSDALLTFAWASDTAQVETLAAMLWFDSASRAEAEKVVATMPEPIRAQFTTPELLYAFFLAAQTQVGPPAGPDILERMVAIEQEPGRVSMRMPGAKPSPFEWGFRQTESGWKVILTPALVPIIPKAVMNNEFFTLITRAQR